MPVVATTDKSSEAIRLKLEFKQERPVKLADLGSSYAAFADQFSRFSLEQGYAAGGAIPSLCVKEIRPGSIIADLISVSDQIDFILNNKELIGGFVTHWKELAEIFLGGHKIIPSWMTKSDVKNVAQFFNPVALEGGSQVMINAQEGSNVFVGCKFNSERANLIQAGVNRYLEHQDLPDDEPFRGARLRIFQARNDLNTAAGDRGIITQFSAKPLKLTWASDEVKAMVLSQDVFHTDFVVDGRVIRVAGEPREYRIYAIRKSGGPIPLE